MSVVRHPYSISIPLFLWHDLCADEQTDSSLVADFCAARRIVETQIGA